MARDPLLSFTSSGIYCPAGDFHIDPWRPVPRALITHGHSDHARPGHTAYLATHAAGPVIRHRLGPITLEGISYAEPRRIGDVTVSFHPAGHVPGSAQIAVTRGGETWVVSGDYKTVADGLCEPFAPVPCHTFITECSFGLPVFHWQDQAEIAGQINQWWAANAADGRVSIIGAYALGKAQRIMSMINPAIGPILMHGAVATMTDILRAQGYPLPAAHLVTPATTRATHPGALVLAPPSALGSAWAARFAPAAEATASGWMALRGIRRRRGTTTGFVLSDHADWPALNAAIRATGASRVLVTHGYTAAFRQWLAHQGYDAGIVETAFAGDGEDPDLIEPPE